MSAAVPTELVAPPPKPFAPVNRQLIVFDFDWSLADQDTDRWVHEVLSPELRRKLKNLKPSMQFTDLCAQLLRELHAQGKTPEDIKGALRKMPFHPAMAQGVKDTKKASKPESRFFLLSNSNEVYIQTILEHQGLLPPSFELFDEIVTNPASFQPDGLLKLERRVKPEDKPHNCQVGCSANMCKGAELNAFLERHGGRSAFDRIIYVGDGGNDYCPVLELGANDVAFVRRYRGLEERIRKEGNVKAEIRWWAGAWEVQELLAATRA